VLHLVGLLLIWISDARNHKHKMCSLCAQVVTVVHIPCCKHSKARLQELRRSVTSVTATSIDNAMLDTHNVTLCDMTDLLQCLS